MATPFDDLPALTRAQAPPPKKREREEERPEQEDEEAQPAPGPPPDAVGASPAAPRPPPKQPRREEDGDDVGAALARLTPHLRSAARVAKAGPLLRQLLDGDGLDAARHSAGAFGAIAAAFADPSLFLSAPAGARLEYARIARSAQRASEGALGWPKRGGGGDGTGAAAATFVSECVGAWALLRLELLSAEDGFALGRALGKVRALVAALPAWQEGDEVEEDEEEAKEAKEEGAEAAAAGATAGATAAADAKATPAARALRWPPRPGAVLLLRRRAALDCALCARDHVHGAKAWAATAVEMALEHVAAAAAGADAGGGGGGSGGGKGGKFAPGAQRDEALALRSFVSANRAARRAGGQGGGAGAAAKDDRGAFERATAQFAAAGNVSARGSVGRGVGAGASAPWLG
jgi:hypothetical protein